MSVKRITTDELRNTEGEGLVIMGCGGDLDEWVDGINGLLTDADILRGGTRFKNCASFEYGGLTCLLFPFGDDVDIDIGKLAIWRIGSHDTFGGTWLSDFKANELLGVGNDESEDTGMGGM